jgi:tRNA pseudouridine38-40 synthase
MRDCLYLTYFTKAITLTSFIGRSCDSRKYTYFFPTYLLIPPKPGCGLHRAFRRQVTSPPPNETSDYPHHVFWMEAESFDPKDDLRRKRLWRLKPDRIETLREAAKKFEGTHNFHNFTVGRDFSDRSNQRHMKKIEVYPISCDNCHCDLVSF